METLKEILMVLVIITATILMIAVGSRLHDECNNGNKASCEALDDLVDSMADVD